MLDVHRSDIIRQEHYFVAVEFVTKLVRQRARRNVPHEVDDEITGAGERIEDVNVFIGQRFSEFLFQDVLDTGDHEIDERLRRVNDAVRVGDLDAESLEEPFIDGVEERLFLGEIGDGGGGIFDCAIEMFHALAEIVPAEHAGVERGDDLFNFLRDDVARDEISDVEDFAEDALG